MVSGTTGTETRKIGIKWTSWFGYTVTLLRSPSRPSPNWQARILKRKFTTQLSKPFHELSKKTKQKNFWNALKNRETRLRSYLCRYPGMKQHFVLWQKDLKKKKVDIMKSSQLNLSNGDIECTRYVPDIRQLEACWLQCVQQSLPWHFLLTIVRASWRETKRTIEVKRCPLNSSPQRGKNSHPKPSLKTEQTQILDLMLIQGGHWALRHIVAFSKIKHACN